MISIQFVKQPSVSSSPSPRSHGERVGVRGNFQSSDSLYRPLTRRASHVDLSPPQVGPARLVHSLVPISGKPESGGERERKPSVIGPCCGQATGAPVFVF